MSKTSIKMECIKPFDKFEMGQFYEGTLISTLKGDQFNIDGVHISRNMYEQCFKTISMVEYRMNKINQILG